MRGTGVREAGKPVSDKNQQIPPSPPSLKTSFAYKKGDREDSQRRNKAKDKRRKKLKRECGKGSSGQGGLGCMDARICLLLPIQTQNSRRKSHLIKGQP